MEPRFEIRYYCTQRMLAEFFRKVAFGPRPPVVIAGAVIYLFALIHSIRWGIVMEMLPLLVALLAVDILVYFLPEWYTWMALRNTKKQNDGEIPETVVSISDVIEMREGMAHYTIEYRKLVRVVRLKHSYVLMIGKRNGLLLDPDGFTKGSHEELRRFLKEKRPDLFIPG